jgi:hypothetical protein
LSKLEILFNFIIDKENMEISTLKQIRKYSKIALFVFLILNGIFSVWSVVNIVKDNIGSGIIAGEPTSSFTIESDVLNITWDDRFSQIENLFTQLNESFNGLNDTFFEYNGTEINLNETFTLDNLISAITITITLPLQINNTGLYNIDPTKISLILSNETNGFQVGPINIPQIPAKTSKIFNCSLNLRFASSNAFRDFTEILGSLSKIEISLETTILFFFPIRLKILTNQSIAGGI